MKPVTVVGGGLAGSEAAWQLARAGIGVRLVEMRPLRSTPVHGSDRLAELVCSNSFRGDAPSNAVGLLKREMALAGSLIIEQARAAAVPAGGALAVDRDIFAAGVTAAIAAEPLIELERGEIAELPEGPCIIATGPLTSDPLHQALEALLGEGALAFYDSIAPIVAADSLNMNELFRQSRYDKGDGADYLNAPMNKEQYEAFIDALLDADKVEPKAFENEKVTYFEACLPIEVMAERGRETLRFGPMKPVGLRDPRTGHRPWAVVQLRQDDLAAEHFNLVGFQTKLTYGEQRRVFRMIPGLAEARFVRLGMIHRNTFINAPAHLDAQFRLQERPSLRLAGQMTGVEGYVESAATGLLAGRMLAAELAGGELVPPPTSTAHGALIRHLTERPEKNFQPSNVTWGLIVTDPEIRATVKGKRPRREAAAEAGLRDFQAWLDESA